MDVSFHSYSNFIKVLGKQTLDDITGPKAVLDRDIDIIYELSVSTHNSHLAKAASNIQKSLNNKSSRARLEERKYVANEFRKALATVHAYAKL